MQSRQLDTRTLLAPWPIRAGAALALALSVALLLAARILRAGHQRQCVGWPWRWRRRPFHRRPPRTAPRTAPRTDTTHEEAFRAQRLDEAVRTLVERRQRHNRSKWRADTVSATHAAATASAVAAAAFADARMAADAADAYVRSSLRCDTAYHSQVQPAPKPRPEDMHSRTRRTHRETRDCVTVGLDTMANVSLTPFHSDFTHWLPHKPIAIKGYNGVPQRSSGFGRVTLLVPVEGGGDGGGGADGEPAYRELTVRMYYVPRADRRLLSVMKDLHEQKLHMDTRRQRLVFADGVASAPFVVDDGVAMMRMAVVPPDSLPLLCPPDNPLFRVASEYNRRHTKVQTDINGASEKASTTSHSFQLDSRNRLPVVDDCRFSGEGFGDEWEVGECSVATQIIPLCKNVLEIGGGTGKVSHMINKLLGDRGLSERHVVVEPGGPTDMGKGTLVRNKARFGDKYTIVKKYASDMDKSDLRPLQGPPDCLYADCEGCLLHFFASDVGKYVLDNVRYVVNEMDGFAINADVDTKLRTIWKQAGFNKIGEGYGCGVRCETDIWYRP